MKMNMKDVGRQENMRTSIVLIVLIIMIATERMKMIEDKDQ